MEESITIVREAFGDEIEFTLAASHPETFGHLGVRVVDSAPSARGYSRDYLRLLRTLDRFDLVVGVGGGYLRAGYGLEALKMGLVHGPQLAAAARTSTPTVYLPQSVGPAGSPVRRVIGRGMRAIDRFYVRDDRTVAEFGRCGVERVPDLAILSATANVGNLPVADVPVVSVRSVRGTVSPLVTDLCRQLGTFDGYIQSETAGNDDRAVMASIGADRILTRDELMRPVDHVRVVVAVRLHAALMALRAGHYVVHLAYERKGFGAFEDLGLDEYVHNVNMFEPERILEQIRRLTGDSATRDDYRRRAAAAVESAEAVRSALVADLRGRVDGARRSRETSAC